jgi:hypothetical protein
MPDSTRKKLEKIRDKLIDEQLDMNAYLTTPEYNTMPERQKVLIKRQLGALGDFMTIMQRRIEYYTSIGQT